MRRLIPLAALAGLVTFGLIASCGDDSRSNDGAGAGDVATTGASSSGSRSGPWETQVASSTSHSPVSACDTIGKCWGNGVSPGSGCTECALFESPSIEGSGVCNQVYTACVGGSLDCTQGGDPDCCAFSACVAACRDANPVVTGEYWLCLCGVNHPFDCGFSGGPAGSCVGDYGDGATKAWDIGGWMDCVAHECVASCSL